VDYTDLMSKIDPRLPELPEALFEAIICELRAKPEGIREFDLLKSLKNHGFFQFLGESPMPAPELFKAHFLLYHCLYLLRDKMLVNKQAWLKIEAVSIQMLSYEEGKGGLSKLDKLRDYYLDFGNLENTSEDDVYELIASFWNKISKHDKRDEALATLGLEDPVDKKIIKDTYRRLAMEHHPDRGGDKERLQEINSAINILLK